MYVTYVSTYSYYVLHSSDAGAGVKAVLRTYMRAHYIALQASDTDVVVPRITTKLGDLLSNIIDIFPTILDIEYPTISCDY